MDGQRARSARPARPAGDAAAGPARAVLRRVPGRRARRGADARHQRGDRRRRRSPASSSNRSSSRAIARSPSRCRASTTYLARRLTARTIATAREQAAKHADLLAPDRTGLRRPRADHDRHLGARIELRQVHGLATRRSPRSPRSPTTGAARSSAPSCFAGARHRRAEGRTARRPEGIVGRRDGTAAVHAVELPQARRRFRRRSAHRHLDVARRTSSARWRTTCDPPAGATTSAGGGRSASRAP